MAWRANDSLMLRRFLRIGLEEAGPDHSTISRTRRRIDVETHREVFVWVLRRVAESGLLKGQTVGIDATTLEANAALRSIVRRDTGEGYQEFLQRLAKESGIATPTREELARLDRKRPHKGSNQDWEHPYDRDARITKMKDGRTHLAHKAEHAVDMDSEAPVIVVAAVTQETNDQKQLVPMLKEVKVQMGSPPRQATADAGYFSEQNVTDSKLQGIDLFVAPDRQKHGEKLPCTTGPSPPEASVAEQMRHKLRTAEGQAVYKLRKAVVEPVFGQIKEGRGFRRFLLRGLVKVQAEWKMICATHNLLKLFRCGWSPQSV